MNLAIDIGNSLAKLAVIENGQVVDFLKTDRPDAAFVAGVLDANPAINAAIAISCRTADSEVESLLRRRLRRFLRFDPERTGPDREPLRYPRNARTGPARGRRGRMDPLSRTEYPDRRLRNGHHDRLRNRTRRISRRQHLSRRRYPASGR